MSWADGNYTNGDNADTMVIGGFNKIIDGSGVYITRNNDNERADQNPNGHTLGVHFAIMFHGEWIHQSCS